MTWALLGALSIGISLGLLGSGGSILTVPVLVYLLHHDEKPAMAESLAIVGSIALIGAVQYAWKKSIDWRSVVFFGVPSMVGAVAGASLAGVMPGVVLLIIFAALMLVASVLMLRPIAMKPPSTLQRPHRSILKITLEGFVVGMMTGLVGAGGGFLIIPALVLLGGLNMHVAIGTSLCIIALKSASGFVRYLDVLENENLRVDWQVIGLFIVVGAAGTIAGQLIAGKINQAMLRRVFGIFLLGMAAYILVHESVKLS